MAIHFLITILPSLNAIELISISGCANNQTCNITNPQDTITNSTPFSITNGIEIKTQIQTFINRSTITATKINVDSNDNYIANFYNYGRIETTGTGGSLESNSVNTTSYKNIHNYGYISGFVYLSQQETQNTNIVNYGMMGGVSGYNSSNKPVTIDNRGTINLFQQNGSGKKIHFKQLSTLTLKNYAMRIKENQTTFNGFSGNTIDNSHLVLDSVTSVIFADASAKMILDFGGDFEAGKEYALNKLVVDTSGTNKLIVEFPRLVPRSDLFSLSQRGDYFIATLNTKASTIGNLYKANVRTMNNFWTLSNSMIYPRKLHKAQNLTRKNQNNLVILRERSDRRISKSNIMLDSAFSLKSYESFAYRNESINRRIQRQNKRNYSHKSQNLKENQRDSQTQRNSQNLSQNINDYYFILTPFVNHNLFFESGRYNLSGLEYGFLTAFSGKLTPSNSLGAHFMMSYGNIGDSKDKDLSIKSLNLNVGINYKFDMIWDMYLKARGDFYYFSNALDSLTIKNIKPNNLGFGVSVSYGKDFNFGKGGVLGIEAGIDYKGLKTNEVSLNSQTYKQSLLNLIYADLGINYNKYFGGFGLNLGTGFKANLAPKLAESTLLLNSQTLKFTLDNDKYLAYANAGISYLMQTNKFNMEFSLAYYGNFGDRVISNGGGVEWRVLF